MRERQLVLVISGLPGVGKTTATYFFRRSNIPILRMGRITDRVLQTCGLKISEKNEQHLREKLRRLYGANVYAKEIVRESLEKLEKRTLIIIEGARSPAEVAYFRNKLPKIQILFIEASEDIRYKRLKERKMRPLTKVQILKRDAYEKQLGIMEIRKIAGFKIQNNSTKIDFYKNLNGILAKINTYQKLHD